MNPSPNDVAQGVVIFYLFILWGGYQLASAALERRMTLAFVAALVATVLVLCAPLALVAVTRG